MSEEKKNALAIFGGNAVGMKANLAKMADSLDKSAEDDPRGGDEDGDYANFSGKRGVYEIGADKVDADENDLWVVAVPSFKSGWICWKGGAPLANRMRSIYEDPEPTPDFNEHGPFDDKKGEGWYMRKQFVMRNVETGKQIVFSTNSKSGINSVASLQKEIAEKVKADDPFIPVVRLGRETFTAGGYKNYKPLFIVEGWLSAEMTSEMFLLEQEGKLHLDVVYDMLDGKYVMPDRDESGEGAAADTDEPDEDDDGEAAEKPVEKAAEKPATSTRRGAAASSRRRRANV